MDMTRILPGTTIRGWSAQVHRVDETPPDMRNGGQCFPGSIVVWLRLTPAKWRSAVPKRIMEFAKAFAGGVIRSRAERRQWERTGKLVVSRPAGTCPFEGAIPTFDFQVTQLMRKES